MSGVTSSTSPTALDAPAVHEAIAPAATLLAERRALYHLAAELTCPDAADAELAEDLLDSPLVRFRLGEALAGRTGVSVRELHAIRDGLGTVRIADGRLPVVADPRANVALGDVLTLVQTQPGLRVLTEADDRFTAAHQLVEQGVRLARDASQALADDLLAHVSLVAMLDPGTSHGLVSASSRFFPGLVLIDQPSSALEVAEALVHEGAHQKFFDLAITHSFLGLDADAAERFETSWSGARWPMEQTVAAWHAYSCMAQFAVDSGVVAGNRRVGPSSLLPVADKRSAEIGKWLLRHENYLQMDARFLLHGILFARPAEGCATPTAPPIVNGHFVVDPAVRLSRREQVGRWIVARAAQPPELYWLSQDQIEVLRLISTHIDGMGIDEIVAHEAAFWNVDPEAARQRVSAAMRVLTQSLLVLPPT